MSDYKPPTCPLPTGEELTAALRTLHNQYLHVYQTLYFNGKRAMPGGGGIYEIERGFTSGNVNQFIIVTKREHPQFYITTREGGEKLMEQIALIEQAVADGKLEKCHSLACCPLAEVNSCVCRISFKCPLHGTQCHGSHD